jgi:hypothetical protein
VNATGADITLNDASGIVLGTTTASNLTVTAGGAVTQVAGSAINVSGGTTTLAAAGPNSIKKPLELFYVGSVTPNLTTKTVTF